MGSLDKVETVVSMAGMDAIDHLSAVTWTDFMSRGADIPESAVMDRIASIKPSDTAALIYTSGTTGNPKGVVLTHDNFDYELECVHKITTYDQGDGYVSWLPCAHVFGQVADNHLWISCLLYTSPSPRDKRQSRMPSSA